MDTKVHTIKFDEDKSQGTKFWLGPIVGEHHVGDFSFLEYVCKASKDTPNPVFSFAVYVKGRAINRSAYSLDEALIVALAHKYDGHNSHAPQYIARMLDMANY